jgi:hypothetical protein
MSLAQILTLVQTLVEAFTAFEAGSSYTLNIPQFDVTLGTQKIALGPIAIAIKKAA